MLSPGRLVAAAVLVVTQLLVTHAGATGVSGAFTVDGNQILEDGQPFVMRGANMLFEADVYGPATDLASTPETAARYADELANYWGFNTVRLELSSDLWLGANDPTNGTQCGLYDDYKTVIDDWVRALTAQHLLTVLDLHTNFVPPDNEPNVIPCTSDASVRRDERQPMADEARAPTFWQQVASRYANRPYVAFEPYNEPQCLTPSEWHDGGYIPKVDSCTRPPTADPAGDPAYFLAAGTQELFNVIRGTGASNLVFVEGIKARPGTPTTYTPGGYDLTVTTEAPITSPLGGPAHNLAYATHIYYGDNCRGLPPDIDEKVTAVAASAPVVIDEFGSSCSADRAGYDDAQDPVSALTDNSGYAAGAHNALVLAYAERNQIGWAAFAFGRWNCVLAPPQYCSYGLVEYFGKHFAPSHAGRPVFEDLRAHPGI